MQRVRTSDFADEVEGWGERVVALFDFFDLYLKREVPTSQEVLIPVGPELYAEIYGASDIVADQSVRDQLKGYEADGYGHFPVCMAKTQYSFTTDPSRKGAPSNHVVPIREVRLSAGAEFIIAICGDIMTMPGLPRVPSAEVIGLNKAGEIEGLF